MPGRKKIIKVCPANTVADFIGRSGLICIDQEENIGQAYNTEGITYCRFEED